MIMGKVLLAEADEEQIAVGGRASSGGVAVAGDADRTIRVKRHWLRACRPSSWCTS
jgi:hypothetical protein